MKIDELKSLIEQEVRNYCSTTTSASFDVSDYLYPGELEEFAELAKQYNWEPDNEDVELDCIDIDPHVDVQIVDDQIRVEVRAEADYEYMSKLGEYLDSVISVFDDTAYFDNVSPGIIEAYIESDDITGCSNVITLGTQYRSTMASSESKDDIDLSEYEPAGYAGAYDVYRKLVTYPDGTRKGAWVAQDQDKKHPPFHITYQQGIGQEPIDDSGVRRLSRELGRRLLPPVYSAWYGGAYDLAPDMYFTKDEIVEFAEEVVDEFNMSHDTKWQISEVYTTNPNQVYIDVMDSCGDEYELDMKIDMRRIRAPRDIYKYKQTILDQLDDLVDQGMYCEDDDLFY